MSQFKNRKGFIALPPSLLSPHGLKAVFIRPNDVKLLFGWILVGDKAALPGAGLLNQNIPTPN